MGIPACFETVCGLALKTAMMYVTALLIFIKGSAILLLCIGDAPGFVDFLCEYVVFIIFLIIVQVLFLVGDRAPNWAHLACIFLWWNWFIFSVLLLIVDLMSAHWRQETMPHLDSYTLDRVYFLIDIVDMIVWLFGGLVYWSFYKEIE